jgi:hypothetical protein
MVAFPDKDWIVMTPEGYFNASTDGARYLNVRQGNKVYSIDNFFDQFYNPALIAQVLSGKEVEVAQDIREGFASPPEVRIAHPSSGEAFQQENIQIVVEAKDAGGGIGEIRLYHNGSVVGEDHRRIKRKERGTVVRKEYEVTLVPGENSFKALGTSRDRTESNPHEIVVQMEGIEKPSDLHLVVVGINQYKNPALNLNFAEPDAKSLKVFFSGKGPSLFGSVHVTEIYNDEAIKENVAGVLNALNTRPQDVIILYFAGHGINIGDEWYFVPHDVVYPERDEEVMTKGLSSQEIAKSIREIVALKKLVLIDACKSGAILPAFANRGLEERRALAQLGRSTGTHVIAASTKDQFASEVSQLGHGVFTYALLRGLEGEAGDRDTKVTVRELIAYVEDKLPEISEKYKQQPQYPVIDSRGQDFPLILHE